MDENENASEHCTRCLLRCVPLNSEIPGEGRPPRPGDCALCTGCGHIMRFVGGMKVRDLTIEENQQMRRGRLWRLVLKPTQELIRERGPLRIFGPVQWGDPL